MHSSPMSFFFLLDFGGVADVAEKQRSDLFTDEWIDADLSQAQQTFGYLNETQPKRT